MGDPVDIERVDHRVAIEVVIEPFGRGQRDDVLVESLHVLDRATQLLGEVLVVAAAEPAWVVRVELEAAPHHVDFGFVGGVRGSPLEPTLADVAPGTDDIRPDLDLHPADASGGSGATPAGRQVSSTQTRSSA